jgi:hypothetical protein
MSDEQFFCDYCGQSSSNAEHCEHCGREREHLAESDIGFRTPLWGKLTIRLMSPVEAERIWSGLAGVWRERVEGLKPYPLPTQMEKFKTSAATLELYGADFMAGILSKALGEQGRIEFQELPHEQLPHSPSSQLPRPPTVPRNKR